VLKSKGEMQRLQKTCTTKSMRPIEDVVTIQMRVEERLNVPNVGKYIILDSMWH